MHPRAMTTTRSPFRYQQFREGSTLRTDYYAPNYRMNYDSRWNIPRSRGNMTYVRHYDDLLWSTSVTDAS